MTAPPDPTEPIAVIAHELRGLAATILIWQEIARFGSANAERWDRALDAIRETALAQLRQLSELIELLETCQQVAGENVSRIAETQIT
jgi:signal transduction histidine kinase